MLLWRPNCHGDSPHGRFVVRVVLRRSLCKLIKKTQTHWHQFRHFRSSDALMAMELQKEMKGDEEEQTRSERKKTSSLDSLDLNKTDAEGLHNSSLSSTTYTNQGTTEDQAVQEPKNEREEKLKETKNLINDEVALLLNTNAPVSDLEKKFRRAERFRMPVQLSEEEKRNSRADRFGTTSILRGLTVINKFEEEQKRKARAERFGLSTNSTGDEEAKKKARLARFATVTKLDGVEEDKRKARALRFSQTSTSNASFQQNGKAKTELIQS